MIASGCRLNAAHTPSATIATATSRLNTCCPGKVTRLSRRPSSLAQAMTEPDSDTAPMAEPMTASASTVVDGCRAASAAMASALQWLVSRPATSAKRSSSTAPMAAAEPPPMPLYSATICGMSVMATFFADTQARPVPSASATRISAMLCSPGRKNVATVAISMPAPAQWMPLRAVLGEAMRCRPSRNKVAATR